MCGRFVITSPPEALRQIFGYVEQPNFPPRHNIAPTQPIPVVIIEQGTQFAAQNPVPTWLEANFENLSGRVLHLPKRQDVNLPINEQLIVELYSK